MIKVLKIGLEIFNFIYSIFKILFPTQKKVLFMSRQGNSPSKDFLMVEAEIKKQYPEYKTVLLCKKIGDSFFDKLSYCFHMINQLHHLAGSTILILDSYEILASCLNHKTNLLIIQMWHSIGTMKKFGYSILDKGEGSSKEVAQAMHMHENYDYIFASAEAYKPHLAQGFNQPMEKIKTLPLPRVELLKDSAYALSVKKKIYATYPQLKNSNKKNLVYCPTFRKTDESQFVIALSNMCDVLGHEQYNIIVKLHPLSQIKINRPYIINDQQFSSFEMLFISDLIVSDYSCIVYEAAILKKPIYFYTFDWNNYSEERDMYMDFEKEIPSPLCANADELAKRIASNYDYQKLSSFTNKYVSPQSHNETEQIVNFIFNNLK